MPTILSAQSVRGEPAVYAHDCLATGQLTGEPTILARGELAAFVRTRDSSTRWVWNDTRAWYPELLAVGVRIERAVDLRLCHTILRSTNYATTSELALAVDDPWDSHSDAPPEIAPNTLFDLIDGGSTAASLDPVAEYQRQLAAIAGSTHPERLQLLMAAESAGALAAAEMKFVGIPWDAAEHDRILTELLGPRTRSGRRPAKLEELAAQIRQAIEDPKANPDSPREMLKSLQHAGLELTSTRSWDLEEISHPVVEPLLEYKRRSRIMTAHGWNWIDTWVHENRFRPVYVPGGVVTGRWASDGGGALQLPHAVRGAVRADPGHVLVVADAAQLEPRILAALSADALMAAAGHNRDLYDGIVASGAVDTRDQAKIGMLGAMYGGTMGESGRMLPRLAKAYPKAIAFVEEAARAGERGERVNTRLGRTSPLPGQEWHEVQAQALQENSGAREKQARSEARSWGRFTRNFVVQGTAAEWALSWMAGIRHRLWTLGDELGTHKHPAPLEARPHLAFFLHDEVMVHTPRHLADAVASELKEAAVFAGRVLFGDAPIDFPVTVAIVTEYSSAK